MLSRSRRARINLLVSLIVLVGAVSYFSLSRQSDPFTPSIDDGDEDINSVVGKQPLPPAAPRQDLRAKEPPKPIVGPAAGPVAVRPFPNQGQEPPAGLPPEFLRALQNPPPPLPADMQAQLNAPPPELPPEMLEQLRAGPRELPEDLQRQLNMPPPELPEDILRALMTPPRAVDPSEVNGVAE